MHMPASRRDYLSGVQMHKPSTPFDYLAGWGLGQNDPSVTMPDVSADAFMPVGVGPQILDPTAMPYAGNFMQPAPVGSWYTPSAPSSPAPVATQPDSWGNWLTQLVPALTAGMNTYAAVEMSAKPIAQIRRMFSTPAGVTPQFNPYNIPSGIQLPPG